MQIMEIQPEEIEEASFMIKGVFNEFISNSYTKEGVSQFNNFADEGTIKKRLSAGSLILIAKEDESIAGLIEISEGSHIPLFFVKREFQGKGVGSRLFRKAVKKYSEKDPSIEVFTVNSSPEAVDFYKILGFRNAAAMQVKSGIRYYPMQYNVNYF
ncbi:MAG TPA: GNAT family N-acetyltransferase [Spirochaetota bacterium]|nr:GNAT family N-acetyltransferase [Spirochaetota bacterium]HPJ36676.1 GNAT family N-acetyltransferase [Spirochaetota bacterium]